MDAHMPRYSNERKAAVLNKLLPPHNRTVVSVSAEEGISDVTLYPALFMRLIHSLMNNAG